MPLIKTFAEFLNEEKKPEGTNKTPAERRKIAKEIKSIIEDFKEFSPLVEENKLKQYVKHINSKLKEYFNLLASNKPYNGQELIEELMIVKDLIGRIKFYVDPIYKINFQAVLYWIYLYHLSLHLYLF